MTKPLLPGLLDMLILKSLIDRRHARLRASPSTCTTCRTT